MNQAQIESLDKSLPKRKEPGEMVISLLPQNVPLDEAFMETLFESPSEFFEFESLSYTRIYKRLFKGTNTYCEFPGGYQCNLSNEMLRSLVFHHSNGMLPASEEGAKCDENPIHRRFRKK